MFLDTNRRNYFDALSEIPSAALRVRSLHYYHIFKGNLKPLTTLRSQMRSAWLRETVPEWSVLIAFGRMRFSREPTVHRYPRPAIDEQAAQRTIPTNTKQFPPYDNSRHLCYNPCTHRLNGETLCQKRSGSFLSSLSWLSTVAPLALHHAPPVAKLRHPVV